jgi:hypothetical protein
MVGAAIVFTVYVVYMNLIHDPQATAFLSHKTDLKRALHLDAWLKVMYVHVVFACVAMLAGSINFSASIRNRSRKLHRLNGYLYAVAVLIVVLTSGYMAPYASGGKLSSIGFNFINMVWPIFTIIAIVKIKKRKMNEHRSWMVRSYVFVFTNLSIHAFTKLFHGGFGLDYPASYAWSLYITIVVLMLAAELVIRTVFRRKRA